jgi:GT2 family glycosyltransferase
MRLGKLILHYNTPELTMALCQMVPGAIVIDNGSSRRYTGNHRCIRFETNYGFTKGWNEAIKSLYDEFDGFWLMNSDITVTRQSVRRVEEVCKNNPEVMMFTPTYNCWMQHCKPQGKKNLEETKVLEFTAPIIRKEVFEKIGFFNEVFVRGYGVEFDFCYRMRQKGLKIFVDHGSSFNHIGHQTIKNSGGLISYSREANFELTKGLSSIYGHSWKSIVLKDCNIKTYFDMNLCVYTTIFGDYDTLKPWPEQNIPASYYVITDNPAIQAPGWKTIVVDTPRGDMHPRMRAKFYKMFPWEVKELAEAKISVFIDASIQVESNMFLDLIVREFKHDMLMFKHPNRNCIYEEAKASLPLVKYQSENIQGQIDFYSKFHPKNAGLYACGILVRRRTDAVNKLMADWWWENIKYTYQDQLSFPVVARANKFTPDVFSIHQYKNEYFKVIWHDDKNQEKGKSKEETADGIQEAGADGKCAIASKYGDVAVLMPIKDTPVENVKLAVESILNQTYPYFTLLIVDDASSDVVLLDYLSSLKIRDVRIIILEKEKSEGLASALDFGLKYIPTDPLVIRMDSDDIADPTLIENHVNWFNAHPECQIRGVQIELFTATKRWKSNHPEMVTSKSEIFTGNKFWFVNHPGIAYRKSLIEKVGGYGDTPAGYAEDYVLWCKVLAEGEIIYNSTDVLLQYRAGDGSQHGQDRESDEWRNFLIETRKKYLNI